MDYGEIFKFEFEILPALGGGFIVAIGSAYGRDMSRDPSIPRQRYAFSNVGDLMGFLAKHAAVFGSPQIGKSGAENRTSAGLG